MWSLNLGILRWPGTWIPAKLKHHRRAQEISLACVVLRFLSADQSGVRCGDFQDHKDRKERLGWADRHQSAAPTHHAASIDARLFSICILLPNLQR